jgi:hypothetical protein
LEIFCCWSDWNGMKPRTARSAIYNAHAACVTNPQSVAIKRILQQATAHPGSSAQRSAVS